MHCALSSIPLVSKEGTYYLSKNYKKDSPARVEYVCYDGITSGCSP